MESPEYASAGPLAQIGAISPNLLANRLEYQRKLLDFLGRHIGGARSE